MQTGQKDVSTIQALSEATQQLSALFKPRQLVLLSGPMGAGKTQFVTLLTQAKGAKEVMSPTFSIINSYECDDVFIDHVDLYRVEDEGDLESTGFWDLFENEEGWVFVEWGDRLPTSSYPANWSRLLIEFKVSASGKKRQINWSEF